MPQIRLRVANGATRQVEMVGSSVQIVKGSKGSEKIHLDEVMIVSCLVNKMYSVRQGFERDGIQCYLNNDPHLRTRTGNRIPFASHPSKYVVPMARPKNVRFVDAYATTPSPEQLIHARYMHASAPRIRSLYGHNYHFDASNCPACLLGVGTHHYTKPKRPTPKIFTYFGEKISSDLCGPFPPSFIHNFIYAIVFYDHFRRKR